MNLAREISFGLASKIADRLMEDYAVGGYDAVYVVYTTNSNRRLRKKLSANNLLPVDLTQGAFGTKATPRDVFERFDFRTEAGADDRSNAQAAILPCRFIACMCESVAGEHGARMTAMENATKNAGEMIASMTLTYNKLRQASITTELIEIISGAEALKG